MKKVVFCCGVYLLFTSQVYSMLKVDSLPHPICNYASFLIKVRMSPLMRTDLRDQVQIKSAISRNAKVKSDIIEQVAIDPIEKEKSARMERSVRIRAALDSAPKVVVGGKESESWNHVFSVMSYDLEKLNFFIEGFGNKEFRNGAVPYVLRDIQILAKRYTPESLRTVPPLMEVVNLLTKKCGVAENSDINVILGK